MCIHICVCIYIYMCCPDLCHRYFSLYYKISLKARSCVHLKSQYFECRGKTIRCLRSLHSDLGYMIPISKQCVTFKLI